VENTPQGRLFSGNCVVALLALSIQLLSSGIRFSFQLNLEPVATHTDRTVEVPGGAA
jgi:hypothetical protein